MAEIAEHVSALKSSLGDNEKFDAAFLKLRGDRSITKNHMQEVAHQVMGWRPGNSNSREGHLQYIRDHQMVRARQTARGENIDKWNR